ncbi:MAG: Cna B-type domain-containing protein, partial [Lachnospiraceae bacterium]|nr:Cna B-type domain-containing protein [Lachnospiraceae bacterium]
MDTTDNTVTVSSAVTSLTNGKRVITYDPEVLTFASLNGSTEERGSGTLALDTNVLYTYAVDPEAGTVTIAFASKTAASGALPDIILNYAEEGSVLTAGQTETTVNTQTLEENASLTPQEAEDHEAVLGYTVSAHVDGGLGTTTADTPLSVEKDYVFSVVATLESGHELDHVTLNGTRLTEGVTAENQRVTATFTVSQDSEIIFYAAGSDTPKVSVSVTKHWEDEEDQDGIRPDSIRVQLYGNGFEVGEPVVLSPDNAWCMTWTDLPAFDNETAIQYTVEELGTVPGYTASLSGTASTGFVLTNTHSVYTTNVTVQKNWSDHENASGVRPSSVTVCLDADNADTGKTLVLTAAGNWTGAFNGLPKRENGRDIQYTIREEQTAGYTSAVTQGIATTFVVTNTINRHTLTFKDGDQVLKESTLDYGETVTAPEDPQKPFHVFAGWDREVPQTMPDEDLTIYATWNAVEGYYLVGDLNEWQVREEYQFAENPQNAGEYYLAANLSVGTEIKVAYASGGVIQGWYPGTEHNYNGKTDNYTVDTDHSGAVTIYFRPAGNSDSYWQPFGGYFYIEKDHEVNVQVAEGSGDAYVIRNGNHETTFTAPRLMTIEVVASAGTHYELDRVELWKKYGNDGPELERVLDGVSFVMGDYDVIVKVYFKYAAHDLVGTEAKDPTCTEPGNEAYWTCTICGKFFSDAEGKTEIEEGSWVIEAMGHDWDLPIYTWTSDNKKVTASRTCYNDPRHEERETVSATYTLIKEATCEETGEGRWTSEAFENEAFTVQTKKVTIKALGHDLVKTDAKDPTCTEAGNTAYWTCSRCGKFFSDAEGKTEITEGSWVIPAMGHDWDAPEYTWSKDYKTVTATRVCYTDRSHKETETVSANFSVTKAATCDQAGEGLWTSDTFQNQAFKVQTKKVTIQALGHDWDTPVITWEGFESAEATRTCKRDASHTETVDLEITSEVTKEAAAWEDGVRTYTASGTFTDGTPVRDTKTEAIPAYGWKWTRLKGTNRYGTMATITKEAYPEEEAQKCTTLIVATGESFPDALAGSALAGVYGCPVILTKSAALSPQAESEIRRLMSEEGCTVLILGGDGAVSPEVEEAIKAIDEHIVVERVKGSNRDRTAITVYEKAFKDENGKSVSDTVIITTGYNYADALSISPYAYAAKTPVLLARKDGSLSDEVKTLLTEAGFEKALIVGGNGA